MPASSFRRLITASAVPALGAFALVALSASPPTAASIATWDKVAQCESTENWSINNGNGYYGGLQFSMSTWREFGGAQYAARADLATKKQQILIGEKVLARQTERAWPTCGPAAGLGRDHADPYPAEPPVIPGIAELATGDFNGDGNSDIAAVPTSGNLAIYPGNGVGSFDAPTPAGTDWNTVANLVGGDFNGDGKADLAAVEKTTGNLFIYTGNGNGTFGTRIFSGTGWNSLDQLTAGDFNGDGKSDIAAVGKGDGNLYIYPGNDVGSFGTPIFAGTGWNSLDQFTAGMPLSSPARWSTSDRPAQSPDVTTVGDVPGADHGPGTGHHTVRDPRTRHARPAQPTNRTNREPPRTPSGPHSVGQDEEVTGTRPPSRRSSRSQALPVHRKGLLRTWAIDEEATDAKRLPRLRTRSSCPRRWRRASPSGRGVAVEWWRLRKRTRQRPTCGRRGTGARCGSARPMSGRAAVLVVVRGARSSGGWLRRG